MKWSPFDFRSSRAWAGFRYRLGEVPWARSLRSRLLSRQRPLAARSELERNVHYLYVEIFWAAIFNAVLAFNATYALRLGATNEMVGWLSSLPSLFAIFVMVPAARWLEARSNPGPWLMRSLALARFGYMGAAFIPWLFPHRAAQGVVYLFVLATVPMTIFSTGFSPMLADVLPERERARVFANRNIILSAVTVVTTLLAGKWLDLGSQQAWAGFPFNYQIIYILGGLTAMMSTHFVSRVKPPAGRGMGQKLPSEAMPVAAEEAAEDPPSVGPLSLRLRFSAMRARTLAAVKGLGSRRDFVRITINTLIFNLGAWMTGPLYMILFVNQLKATDGWVGLNSALANLGVILGYAFWRPRINRLGDNAVLRVTAPLAASYSFLVAFFPNLTLILIWGILINLVNAGVNLSWTNVFYRVCPEERRASYMAVYSTVVNAGAFVCPMIGVALSNVMDIRLILLIGGVVRLFGGAMFLIWRLEEGREPAADR